LLRVLLCGSHCYKLSPFQAHWGRWHCTRLLRPACLFTAHVRSGSSPLSCGVFLPPLLLQAFLLLVTLRVPLLLPSPAALLWGISTPHSSALRAPRPLCCMSFLLLLLVIQFFFLFSLGGGSVCLGGYADLAQGCLWEYRMPLSSPCGRRLPNLSGCWHLCIIVFIYQKGVYQIVLIINKEFSWENNWTKVTWKC
jgi:hypothetical protein